MVMGKFSREISHCLCLLREPILNLVKRILVIFRKHQREYVRKIRFSLNKSEGLITDKQVEQIRLIDLEFFILFSIGWMEKYSYQIFLNQTHINEGVLSLVIPPTTRVEQHHLLPHSEPFATPSYRSIQCHLLNIHEDKCRQMNQRC